MPAWFAIAEPYYLSTSLVTKVRWPLLQAPASLEGCTEGSSKGSQLPSHLYENVGDLDTQGPRVKGVSQRHILNVSCCVY